MDGAQDDYAFQEIIDCEIRYFKPAREEDTGRLELWWRIKWSTGTSTLEPESVFAEFKEDHYIEDFIVNHKKSLQRKATSALQKYPRIQTISSSFYPLSSTPDSTADEHEQVPIIVYYYLHTCV